MKKFFYLLLCPVLMFLFSCAAPQEEVHPLHGKTFQLADAKGHKAMMTFNADGNVNGNSGVNRFFGQYKTAGDQIIFYQMGSTKMAGAPDAMKFEDNFMGKLGKVNRFFIVGRNLTFFAGDIPVLTMKLAE